MCVKTWCTVLAAVVAAYVPQVLRADERFEFRYAFGEGCS